MFYDHFSSALREIKKYLRSLIFATIVIVPRLVFSIQKSWHLEVLILFKNHSYKYNEWLKNPFLAEKKNAAQPHTDARQVIKIIRTNTVKERIFATHTHIMLNNIACTLYEQVINGFFFLCTIFNKGWNDSVLKKLFLLFFLYTYLFIIRAKGVLSFRFSFINMKFIHECSRDSYFHWLREIWKRNTKIIISWKKSKKTYKPVYMYVWVWKVVNFFSLYLFLFPRNRVHESKVKLTFPRWIACGNQKQMLLNIRNQWK